MGIQFQFLQQPEMRLEILPLEEIVQVIEQRSPFSDFFVKEEKILKYCRDVNGRLMEYDAIDHDRAELKMDYITAAAVYIFPKHLLHMDFLDEPEQHFLKTAGGEPYEMQAPLDLYFTDAESAEECTAHDEIKTITESTISNKKTFKMGAALYKRIEDELKRLYSFLQNSYSREAHFAFVGYFDICSRLFRMDFHKKEHLQSTNEALKNDCGSYLIKIPNVL
jgi:hypothetical protein